MTSTAHHQPEQPAADPLREPGGTVVPVTVIVADDNERFRSGIVRALRRRPDVEVLSDVENGANALRDIRALRPRLVLVDARMPILDGLGVAREVTADPDLRDVRVVLLSARHDRLLTEDARVAGAVACLDKSDSRREICDAALSFAGPSSPV